MSTAAGSVRLRHTALATHIEWMNGTGDRANPKDFKPSLGKTRGTVDFDVLFRKDAMKDAVFTYTSKQGNTVKLRLLDDVTILRTFLNEPDSKGGMKKLVWDPAINGMTDSEIRTFHQKIVEHCHRERGIQVFAGYSLNQDTKDGNIIFNSRHDAFRDWLKQASPSPSVSDVIDNIVKFMDDNLMFTNSRGNNDGFDGICFDIEGLQSGPDATGTRKIIITSADEQIMKTNLKALYQGLADKLGTSLSKPERGVAFFGAAFVADNQTQHGVAPPTVAAKIHTLDIASGRRNLIFRAMAYDAFDSRADSKTKEATTFKWHREVVEFAVKNISAQNYQLGVKTFDGTSQVNPPFLDAVVKTGDLIEKRCTEILSPNNVGLFYFGGSASFWRGCNKALNPSLREAGRYSEFHPHQWPLDGTWQLINQRDSNGNLLFPVPDEIKD